MAATQASFSRIFLVVLWAVSIPGCGAGTGSNGSGTAGGSGGAGALRPSIVYIVADDLGYADLGAQGSTEVLTPNLDTLAAEGVRFTNGYASAPVCSPTRAGLITGRYQQRFGHELNPGKPAPPNFGLPSTELTLPQLLKARGYATGMVGKWHLGERPGYLPMDRGFDEFFGFLGGAHSYVDWNDDPANPILRGTTPVVEDTYLTDAFAREAVDFIRRHSDGPFFLYLSFNAVHGPLDTPPRRYVNRFPDVTDPDRRNFLAMLAAMDDAVEAVLAELRGSGIGDDTLILFHSDNGGATNANTSLNTPLRGAKKDVYEGGIRVPFLARWKAKWPAGFVFDDPVSSMDFFATALAAAGGAVPNDRAMDGVDLGPYLEGTLPGPPHPILYWRFGTLKAVLKEAWKLVKIGSNPSELYDLAVDVGETTNLAGSQPAKVAELEADLASWEAQLIPPLW
jgi:arylsulfatase A-like enzyme